MLNLNNERLNNPDVLKSVSGAMKVSTEYGAARAVANTDNTPLPAGACDALWIGTTGNIKVLFENDEAAVTLDSVPVGLFPFRVLEVWATGTTASNIVALYKRIPADNGSIP